MRWIRLMALLVCAVPLALATKQYSHWQPAARPNLNPSMDRDQPNRDTTPYTADEWAKVEKWMNGHCPNRMKFIERMSDNETLKEHAKQLLVERYRQIERSPFLHDALVREAEAQDEIFGAQIKLRALPKGRRIPNARPLKLSFARRLRICLPPKSTSSAHGSIASRWISTT